MESADLGEQGPKGGDLGGGLRRKSHGITSKLGREDLVIVLSELIEYAERMLHRTLADIYGILFTSAF